MITSFIGAAINLIALLFAAAMGTAAERKPPNDTHFAFAFVVTLILWVLSIILMVF